MDPKLNAPLNEVLRHLPNAQSFEIDDLEFTFEWRGNAIWVGLMAGQPAVRQITDDKAPAKETALSYVIERLIL
jgi:hypothetical protein